MKKWRKALNADIEGESRQPEKFRQVLGFI